MQAQPLASGGRRPGQVEGRRAGDAGLRKLQLAPGLGQEEGLALEAQGALHPHALEGPGIVRLRRELHQGGIEPGALVAQGLRQLVAVHDAAELCTRGAAAGEDQLVRVEALIFQLHGEALLFPAQVFHRGGAALLHPGPVQGEAQHVQHGIGGIGQGIDPSPFFLLGQQAQAVEEVQGRLGREGLQGGQGESGVLPVVVFRPGAGIGQVAAAVARCQELAADALLPLQQQHPVILVFRGGEGGQDAGGASADDDDSVHGFILDAACRGPRGCRRGG